MPIKDNKLHHSYKFIPELKELENKFKGRIQINYRNKENDEYILHRASTIIIVDDYCGSGNTIIKMLDDINNILNKTINIIIAPLFITYSAIDNIKDNVCHKYHNFTVSFEHSNDIRKAKYLSVNNVLSNEELKKYEEIAKDNHLIYPHGYNSIEELLAFSYCTPNNTVGILWENSFFRIPFLGRDNNKFIDYTKKKFFSNEEISNLRRCIKYTVKSKMRKKIIFAILLLLEYPDDQIYTRLRFEDFNEYNEYKKKVFSSCMLRKNRDNKIVKGKQFKNYVNDELFTRLVYLNDNRTRFNKSNKKFLDAIDEKNG